MTTARPAPPATAAASRRERALRGLRSLRPPAPDGTPGATPGGIRARLVLVLAVVAGLLAVLVAAVGNARDAVQTIGRDQGPQVVVTSTLYFALSDMDAQVANVLLSGREHDLGITRDASLRIYERRRAEADAAAVQAAQLAGGDTALRRTVQDILDGLGRYERLVGRALLLSEQADHPPGETPQDVLDAYREATDLMTMEILPKAYNITLDSGAQVRQAYETKRSAVLSGRAWLLLLGALAVALLLVLQVYLARAFRRLLNPALALATLGTVALTAAGSAVLSANAAHLERAKEDGFDSVLALSRARAISHSAFADQARYLLDPARADTYEQVYLDKSLSIMYPDMGAMPLNLENYTAALRDAVGSPKAGASGTSGTTRQDVAFLGFFGEEARETEGLAAAALRWTLEEYVGFQDSDRHIRARASGGDRAGAVRRRMDRRVGAIAEFRGYDRALTHLTSVHQDTFDGAIAAADRGLRGWTAVPAVAVAAIALLAVAGVRPRLAEFR